MKTVEHKGYTIEIRSSRGEGTRWRAHVRIRAALGGTVYDRTLNLPPEQTFADEAEADFYAIQAAVQWIDDRG